MTPEEADMAYDEAPAIPISDEEIERLVSVLAACQHNERFRGVMGIRNGCVACELEKVQNELVWYKMRLRKSLNAKTWR